MHRILPLLLAISLATPAALAAPPAEGTPEHAIRASLQMIRDGRLDQWIADWCASTSCRNTQVNEEMKGFGLARAQKNAATCLHGADEDLVITRTKGDATKDEPVTVWIKCDEQRMPVPATLVREAGRWKVSSFSW